MTVSTDFLSYDSLYFGFFNSFFHSRLFFIGVFLFLFLFFYVCNMFKYVVFRCNHYVGPSIHELVCRVVHWLSVTINFFGISGQYAWLFTSLPLPNQMSTGSCLSGLVKTRPYTWLHQSRTGGQEQKKAKNNFVTDRRTDRRSEKRVIESRVRD